MPSPLTIIQSAMVQQQVPALDASGQPKQKKAAARILGSGAAGALELLIFHPVDTVAKRLMSNKQKIGTDITLSQVIFKDAQHKNVLRKWSSLFPGFGFAAGYKVLQRVYKFGGQPFVHGLILDSPTISNTFYNIFGKDTGKTMMQATAGSLIGVGEILLLPLDVLKIKAQTNPDALKGFNVARILGQEGLQLYRGAMWTAARNAPGSFALFGANAWVHHHVFHLDDPRKATFTQNFVASLAGGVASITVAAPLDTIKTRIQSKSFTDSERGASVLRDLIRNEGVFALFKGLTPKLLIVGPKLVFSFTVAQHLISYFTTTFNK